MVTPVFNAARFLPACLASVLDQAYPRLQYVVMDGGSTDGSAEAIAARADRLHAWRSHPDDGPYAAIAEGFALTDGEVMGWINADDVHLPWALELVGGIFRDCPEVQWVTTETPLEIAADGLPFSSWRMPGFTRAGFRRRENLPEPGTPYATGFIQQESTFWRRSLWDKVGGRFPAGCRLAGDFALWDAFFDHAELHSVDLPLGAFRRHGAGQISVASREQYLAECHAVLARHGLANDARPATARRMRMVGLAYPGMEPFLEPAYIVRRRPDTGRFFTQRI